MEKRTRNQNRSMTKLHIEKLTEPISESNCYVLYEIERPANSCILIDPGDFSLVEQYLIRNQLQPEYVLLTHEHHDHIAGLNELRKKYELKVICSELCSQGIQNASVNFSRHFAEYLYFKRKGELYHIEAFTCDKADVTYQKEYVLVWQSHCFRLFETPGHSKGGSCILADNEVLFTGDTLLIDHDVILRFPGGSKKLFYSETMPQLQSLKSDIWAMPGHGKNFLLWEGLKKIEAENE